MQAVAEIRDARGEWRPESLPVPSPLLNGFHRMVVSGDTSIASDNFFHYLHHRLFTIDFGVEALPLDWWLKTQHDGSAASLARMRGRTAA
jgi:hypothetical protein